MTKADLVVKGVQYIIIDKEAAFSIPSLKKKKVNFRYNKEDVFEDDNKEYVKFSDMYFD